MYFTLRCLKINFATGGNLSQQLNKVNIPIFDYDQCKTIFGDKLSNQMICAGHIEGGRDSCWVHDEFCNNCFLFLFIFIIIIRIIG